MTSPISGPLHQAVDTLAGPADELRWRLKAGSIRDLHGWSDTEGEVTGIDAVVASAAQWWEPETEVYISVLDGVAAHDELALLELMYLSSGAPVNLGHAVVGLHAGQDVTWRQHGDPTAARRRVELPDFPRVHVDGGAEVADRQQDVVRDFFARHDEIGGVLDAWQTYASADVLLWHSAEGVRARGKDALLTFYAEQHARYRYSSVRWELHSIASRPGYTAGEITYTLTHDEHPPIVLPASFAVDFGPDDKIRGWRNYSRWWIPT
jgi:hypothetical protein